MYSPRRPRTVTSAELHRPVIPVADATETGKCEETRELHERPRRCTTPTRPDHRTPAHLVPRIKHQALLAQCYRYEPYLTKYSWRGSKRRKRSDRNGQGRQSNSRLECNPIFHFVVSLGCIAASPLFAQLGKKAGHRGLSSIANGRRSPSIQLPLCCHSPKANCRHALCCGKFHFHEHSQPYPWVRMVQAWWLACACCRQTTADLACPSTV